MTISTGLPYAHPQYFNFSWNNQMYVPPATWYTSN
jgi:hypothetical protein